jgi:hypothetical protein
MQSNNVRKHTVRILKSQDNSLNELITLAKEKYDLKISKNRLFIIAIALFLTKTNSNGSEFDKLLKKYNYI